MSDSPEVSYMEAVEALNAENARLREALEACETLLEFGRFPKGFTRKHLRRLLDPDGHRWPYTLETNHD